MSELTYTFVYARSEVLRSNLVRNREFETLVIGDMNYKYFESNIEPE